MKNCIEEIATDISIHEGTLLGMEDIVKDFNKRIAKLEERNNT